MPQPANTQAIKDNASAREEFVNVIGSKTTAYADKFGLGDIVDIADINDVSLREMLLHEMARTTSHRSYDVIYRQNGFLDFMSMFNIQKATTQAFKVGFLKDKKYSTVIKGTGNAPAGAGQRQKITLHTDFSPAEKYTAVTLTQTISYGASQLQGIIVGIDTGDSRTKGKTVAGITLVPGGEGGTTTAHVIIVEPLQNGVTLPAVTLTSGLFVFSNLQKEGSCPMDSTVTQLPDRFYFGSSTIRTDFKTTRHATSTVGGYFFLTNPETNVKRKIIASKQMLDNKLEHYNRCMFAITIGQKATNPIIEEREVKQNNGFLTTAIADGGTYHTHTIGSFSWNADMKAMFGHMTDNGITEAVLYCPDALYEAIQAVAPPNAWGADLQFSPKYSNAINPYQFDFNPNGMKINYTVSCVEYGGKIIWLYRNPYFGHSGTLANSYANTGVLIPLKTYNIIDAYTQQPRDAFAIQVHYQKDALTDVVADINNMWTTGGASNGRTNGCDTVEGHYVTQLTTEVTAPEELMVVQGI